MSDISRRDYGEQQESREQDIAREQQALLYPVSTDFERFLTELRANKKFFSLEREMIEAYEHGSVDIEDLFQELYADATLPVLSQEQMLKIYALVLKDLIRAQAAEFAEADRRMGDPNP